MSKLLANYAQQIQGPTPPTAEDTPGRKTIPPEHAMALWWKKQDPKLSDQQAWERGQATLDLARKGDPRSPEKQLVLGLYLHHSDPDRYQYPTMQSPLGGQSPFGPQPPQEGYATGTDYGPANPSPVLQSFGPPPMEGPSFWTRGK